MLFVYDPAAEAVGRKPDLTNMCIFLKLVTSATLHVEG